MPITKGFRDLDPDLEVVRRRLGPAFLPVPEDFYNNHLKPGFEILPDPIF